MSTWARAAAALTLLIISAAVAVGCLGDGDDEGGGGPDPATLAPASTPVYVEAAVRPEGSVRSGAEAALGKILNTEDPGTRLQQDFDGALRDAGAGVNYSRDIAPWLGQRAGFFLPSIGSDGVLAIATIDPDKALAAANRAAKRQDTDQKQRSYKGASFKVDSSFDAHGLIGDFLVLGSARDFRAAVDASQGQSLAEDKGFEESFVKSRETAVGGLYVQLDRLLRGIERDDEESALGARILRAALGGAGRQPIVATVTPAEDRVTVDVSSGAPPGADQPRESKALADLPADAWAALGLADLAGTARDAVKSIESSGEEGTSAEELRSALDEATGLDLDEDILAWPQDMGLFAQGRSLDELGVALLIFSSDAVLSQRAIAKLTELAREGGLPGAGQLPSADETTAPTTTTTTPAPVVPGEEPIGPVQEAPIGGEGFTLTVPSLPQAIEVQSSDDRVVIGYGAAAQAALAPPAERTLGDTAPFKQARAALGEGFTMTGFANFAPAVALLDSTGLADDRGYKRVRSFLVGLSFMALGSSRSGERSTLRAVIGLR